MKQKIDVQVTAAADALACAICHGLYQSSAIQQYTQQGLNLKRGRLA